MANLAAFYDTRECFRKNINYTEPLSYDQWVTLSDDQKVVFLYVQFYNEITTAWIKANNFNFVDAEEGVDIVLQYLQKQVCDRYIKGHPKKKVTRSYFESHRDECEERRIIEENPKRFSPGYIYKIAYNCMYCICHDLKSVQDRWDNETDNVVEYDGESLSLIDLCASRSGSSAEDDYEQESFENEFWSVIEDIGVDAEKVMRYLLSNNPKDLKKLNKRDSSYNFDPLRNIEVSMESATEIIEKLRNRFLSMPTTSKCGSYILQSILS